MKSAVKWALVAAVGLVPVGANAATYSFDFSTLDSVFTATGAITIADTLDAVGGYDVLSITGTMSGPGGGTIALIPDPSQPFPGDTAIFQYDNVYFPSAPAHVDENGILFSAGEYNYNLFSIGPTYYLSSDNPAAAYNPGEPLTFSDPVQTDTLTSAPEPSTWALMLLGFAGLCIAARRNARRSAAALSAPSVGPAQKA